MEKVAIIDPVGIKAGMNGYDLGLLDALQKKKIEVFSFSNFKDARYQNIHQKAFFLKEKKGSVTNIFNFLYAHFRVLFICKKDKIRWVILHLFSAASKDYFSYFVIKLFKINIITIVHDIESLSNEDNPRYRKKMYNWSSALVVHNKTSKKLILPSLSEPYESKLVIIPHGNYIDFISADNSGNAFFPTLHFEKGVNYLLFFGQIKPAKGLDILLKAMAILPENYKLIIAGRPHRDNFQEYESIIRELKITDKVIQFIRFITDGERDFLFKHCDALILPYRKIFQSGVLLLSMSYGLPVVASDLPANQEIIQNKKTGMLFEEGNSADLAEKIIELFSRSSLNIIKQNAADVVQNKFSWQQIAESYISIIKEQRINKV